MGNNGGLLSKTTAGAGAFALAGVGTIVAAIGDFGSDNSALAAARRNHVGYLVAAASLASLGLGCGALYTVLSGTQWKESKALKRAATVFLVIGVVAVAAGVGVGAVATSRRDPGRPTIAVERLDAASIRVQISAEGLESDAWYEATVLGYPDDLAGYRTTGSHPPSKKPVDLLTVRFSPNQDGKLDWSARISTADSGETKIGRVLVRVADGAVKSADLVNCTAAKVTCLAVRVPEKAPSTTPQG
jgi:hypothetical protein